MIVHGYRPTPNALILSRSGPMGERCMKDTVHPPVHPSVHPAARTSVTTTSPCRSSDTHFGRGQNTGLGWNDPGLAAFPRPKHLRGRSSPVFLPVAASAYRSKQCRGPSSPSEDGKKCLLHPWSFHVFTFGSNIDRILKEFPRLPVRNSPRAKPSNRAGGRPRIFGFQPPKKFSGSLPPDVGLRCARFLANARQPRSLPTEFQFWVKWASRYTFTLANFAS